MEPEHRTANLTCRGVGAPEHRSTEQMRAPGAKQTQRAHGRIGVRYLHHGDVCTTFLKITRRVHIDRCCLRVNGKYGQVDRETLGFR
jgi:hypothetical protein